MDLINKVKLAVFTTSDGIFIASQDVNYSGRNVINSKYIVNGKNLIPTHHKAWFLVKGESEIKTIEEPFPPKREPDEYVLRDSSLFVDGKIPLSIPYKDVEGYYDCDDDWLWRKYTCYDGFVLITYEEVNND